MLDPNNHFWSKDTNRFGYQMMMKMGWKDGKGLGVKEDGITTHVRIKKKNDSKGIGAEDMEEQWIVAGKEYQDILSSLNKVCGNKEENIIERPKTLMKFRPKKLMRSKQVSSYSTDDLNAIFGKSEVQKEPKQPVEIKEDPNIFTTKSSLSIQEYFKQKKQSKTKNQKRKRDKIEENEDPIQQEEELEENQIQQEDIEENQTQPEENQTKPKKKQSKKRRKNQQ